jgi:hypothetical protein
MKTSPISHAFRPFVVLLVLLATALFAPAAADEHGKTIADPGFRPDSEHSRLFLDSIGDTSFIVLPTMIHRIERTAHSFDSQKAIVDFLNENQLGQATSSSLRIDQGILERRSQWDLFNRGIGAVSAAMGSREPMADYTMVMEILVPGDQAVFGIHVYILDREGRNAFSFLLNSHHEIFRKAELVAADSSEEARARMIAGATRTGLRALQAQIDNALECARRSPIVAPRAVAGILHDFDAALPSGTDEFGVPVGYSTFAGPDSRVSYRIAESYPVRDGSTANNGVLRIDLDVNSWGGVVNLFTTDAADRWVPQDWRELEGFSFWFYGANSGAPVYVDVFDNRRPCSRTDDAERFRYRFMDDVSGWRQISVRFADLERWNVGNNALEDGFGLNAVHGWGIGTSNSEGPVNATFFLDEFRLLNELPDVFSESEGLLRHGKLTELRIDDFTSRIETSTGGDGRPVAYQVIDLMCACVRLTLERDYSYFRIDERETLNGDRARFRLSFYAERPTDVPVLEIPEPGSKDAEFSMSGAISADQMQSICVQNK